VKEIKRPFFWSFDKNDCQNDCLKLLRKKESSRFLKESFLYTFNERSWCKPWNGLVRERESSRFLKLWQSIILRLNNFHTRPPWNVLATCSKKKKREQPFSFDKVDYHHSERNTFHSRSWFKPWNFLATCLWKKRE